MSWFLLALSCARTPPPPPPPAIVPAPPAGDVFRVAFGSCAHQNKDQPVLATAAGTDPDLFVWLGDNIYGDTDDMAVLQAKYDKLAAKPEFQRLWEVAEVRAVWDDHDYGRNDAGKEYPHRLESESIFLDFWRVPESSGRRQHEGIYGAEVFTDGDHTVQLILLDTRSFRDPVARKTRGYKNSYRPHPEPGSAFLGEAQWAWLAEALRVPATVRIIASSTQFGHEYNGWESWTNFPFERQRMVRLLREAGADSALFISGDVHWGEISRYTPDDGPPIYDVTSSGITQTWPSTEPNANRTGPVVRENNFGLIEIAWDEQVIDLQLRNVDNAIVSQARVPFAELQVSSD